jgi:hypothetical protein
MSRPLLPAVLLLGWAAACASQTRPRGDPDAGTAPVEVVGRSCNVDAECGELRCDKVRRQCICLSDESCRGEDGAPPRYCNNYTGLCVEEISGCGSDAACASTEYCDPSLRACLQVKGFCQACTRDEECGGASDHCLALGDGTRTCGRACTADADCPRGAACTDAPRGRQCMPSSTGLGTSCEDFRGCIPDSRQACATDADCGTSGDQRCDASRGQCVALQQVCPADTTCDPRDRVCVSDCAVDADCGAGLRCVDRVCEPDTACLADTACAVGKVCVASAGGQGGECRTACQEDAQCPLGEVCTPGTDGRNRCVPGCTGSSGCPLDKRCNATSRQCEGPLVGGVTVCQATVACPSCQVCTAQQSCAPAMAGFPYCQSCSSSADCPGGVCLQLLDGLACARTCGGGQECPSGFTCLGYGGVLADGGINSACVPADRVCAGKCP